MSVTTANHSNVAGYKARGTNAAGNVVPLLTTGVPFHLYSGGSVVGAGVITSCNGNPTIDGVTISSSGVLPFLRFKSSASITSGRISGVLLPTDMDSLAIPTRRTSPTTYSTSVGGTPNTDGTATVASIGTNMGVCTGIRYYTSHSGINPNYPPSNMDWQWFLYVNSIDTGYTDLEVWYAAHSTGSYSRFNTDSTAGLLLPFRGTLKVRLITSANGDANMGAYCTVTTY